MKETNEKKQDENQSEEVQQWFCPECGHPVEKFQVFCDACGKKVELKYK